MSKPLVNKPIELFEFDIASRLLKRKVHIRVWMPGKIPGNTLPMLLINDGQQLDEINLPQTLSTLIDGEKISPVCCVGIHAPADRKQEYGVAGVPDYLGRGHKAGLYAQFITNELLPFLSKTFSHLTFTGKSIAGFSLGGLSALDIAWQHPAIFNHVGVFSGSLWWRSVDHEDESYQDDEHRIMQQQIRKGPYRPGLKFFFQCGSLDETEDRNNNGIIDSIDDTLDIIKELEIHGYKNGVDIQYVEMTDGRHDMETWGRAMPQFLEWAFGK